MHGRRVSLLLNPTGDACGGCREQHAHRRDRQERAQSGQPATDSIE